ncbi:MAG: thioredoxin family protein [Bacteroidetes bacterium]|nr:thioredoxin family protein [Bacteroidota bacterium]
MLEIKVLGSGCPNCIKLEKLCREALIESGLDGKVEKLTTQADFDRYGIWMTPALIINEKILLQGKLPTKNTLLNWMKKAN